MKVRILDATALSGVNPGALAAYAGSLGWAKVEPYGDVADVWFGEGLPEIVLPRTSLLGDYASVVSRLIGIFSEVSGTDEVATLKDLLEVNHDVIRVRAMQGATNGSIALDTGVEIVSQARAMLLAAVRATLGPRLPVYPTRADKKATDFVKRIRLGQTEHGSFVVTLMAPISPTVATLFDDPWRESRRDPRLRDVIHCLIEALEALKRVADLWHRSSYHWVLEDVVSAGISANLCVAVARLIRRTNRLEVSVAWAMSGEPPLPPARIEFSEIHRRPLEDAAKALRTTAKRPGTRLVGTVHTLRRDRRAIEGVATFKAELEGRIQSVIGVLDGQNYSVAIRAHESGSRVIVVGDLERIGQRWRVTNASVREFRLREDG